MAGSAARWETTLAQTNIDREDLSAVIDKVKAVEDAYQLQRLRRTESAVASYSALLVAVKDQFNATIREYSAIGSDQQRTATDRNSAKVVVTTCKNIMIELAEAFPKFDASIMPTPTPSSSASGSGGARLNLRDLGVDSLPKFTGDPTILHPQLFLVRVEQQMKLRSLSGPETAQVAALLCKDQSEAGNWVNSLVQQDSPALGDYTLFKKAFKERFKGLATIPQKALLRQSLQQKPSETVLAFLDCCTNASYILYDRDTESDREKLEIEASRKDSVNLNFILGVLPHIRAKIVGSGANTTEEIKTAAVNAEEEFKAKERAKSGTFKGLELAAVEDDRSTEPSMDAIKLALEAIAKDRGKPNPSMRCFYCNAPGHFARECQVKRRAMANQPGGQRGFRGGFRGNNFRGRGSFRGRGGPSGFNNSYNSNNFRGRGSFNNYNNYGNRPFRPSTSAISHDQPQECTNDQFAADTYNYFQ